MAPYPVSDAPSDEEGAARLPRASRRYDLDWLRIIAIVTLLFYHTGMIYVSWGWHIKSTAHSQPMEEVMRWLHGWRMPLLFFISGAGTYFALLRRSWGSYAGERVRRLFVPLVFGMFVIVPPQIYYEWLFKGWFAGSYADFYPEVLRFRPYYEGVKSGAFSWHHLWFILYLLIYGLVSIPVFKWLRRPAGQRFTDRIGRLIGRPGGALWLVVPMLVNDVVLGGLFPWESHALYNDWAYFMKNLILFWLGYLLISRDSFWPVLTSQRRLYALATLVCTVLLYGARAWPGEDIIDRSQLLTTLYSFVGLGLTWFSVLMTVSYGYRYLNVDRPMLARLNEAVYPFYILHQTVIVGIGYYVLTRTRLGVYDGFLVVSLASGLGCIGLYLLLIRPIRPVRFLFGMK
ncbi:hypothetical protein GCM10027578_22540 [Spirosoma luteolum]